ncbi:NUDIX domain-containing protein [Nocardia sp. CA-107356]|uniref:NUDIX domain-containing protein n=1 Tax=Nocardia sp. CA-107356 TaxID=3239972 RepID=UPI003D915015
MRVATTELIARAVIGSLDGLLVARERGKSYVFLPGGHVEPGEPVEDALVRELNEEIGASASIGRLLGVVEHGYVDDTDTVRHELNLIFTAHIIGEPVSQEAHLEFLWLPLDQLPIADLRPCALKDALATNHANTFWRRWNR